MGPYTRLPDYRFQRKLDCIAKEHNLKGVVVYSDNITIAGKSREDHYDSLDKFNSVIINLNLTLNPEKCVYSTSSVDLLGYTIVQGNIKPDADWMKPLLDIPLPTSNRALDRTLGLFAYYSKWCISFPKSISIVPNYDLPSK